MEQSTRVFEVFHPGKHGVDINFAPQSGNLVVQLERNDVIHAVIEMLHLFTSPGNQPHPVWSFNQRAVEIRNVFGLSFSEVEEHARPWSLLKDGNGTVWYGWLR
jgi:hypothetical protein